MWNLLNGPPLCQGGPILSEDDYCLDCILKKCQGILFLTISPSLLSNTEERESQSSSKEKQILLQQLADMSTGEEQEGYWISKNWLKGMHAYSLLLYSSFYACFSYVK